MLILLYLFQTPLFTIPSSLTIDVTSSDVSADEVQLYDIDITNTCTCCNFTCDVICPNAAQVFYVTTGNKIVHFYTNGFFRLNMS